jgi:hypothetical protein
MLPLAARRWQRPSLTPVALALALIFILHRAERAATGSIAHADLH